MAYWVITAENPSFEVAVLKILEPIVFDRLGGKGERSGTC